MDPLFNSKVNFAKISDAEQTGPKILKMARNKSALNNISLSRRNYEESLGL